MTSNSYTVETFLDFLEDTTKHTDRVLDRHTRHYYDAHSRLSSEEWEILRREAHKRFDVDVDELVERGEMYYATIGIDPPA